MTNRRFFFPFWYYFGSLLVYLSKLFRYIFWDAFLDASFPTFGLKWFPKRSDQKGLRRHLGAPGSQRRPKGLPKSNYSPRPFSNRMPNGGPCVHPMPPGPSGAPFFVHFRYQNRPLRTLAWAMSAVSLIDFGHFSQHF